MCLTERERERGRGEREGERGIERKRSNHGYAKQMSEILLQCVCLSNHNAHFKYLTILFANCTSINLKLYIHILAYLTHLYGSSYGVLFSLSSPPNPFLFVCLFVLELCFKPIPVIVVGRMN